MKPEQAVAHTVYALRNAPLLTYPYPHFHAHEVFPWPFYDDLLKSLPGNEAYQPLAGGFKHRVAHSSLDFVKAYDTPHFASHVLSIFSRFFFDRYPHNQRPRFRHEIRFIRDEEGYSIGPHTDAPHKVVSLLFYLPAEYGYSDHGTGIYVPDDGVKTCPGGPHYPFDGFSEVWRAPYVPNSCFGFWKTDNSWHAVQQICEKIQRDVMLFNIYEDSAGT